MTVLRHLIPAAGPVFLLLLTLSCGLTNEEHEGVRYYEFTNDNEEFDYSFVAKTSDPDVIAAAERQLALPITERNLHIHGDIARGDGGYNTGWSWHFVPDQWELVEVSVEVCDGHPQMLENNLDYWINEVGYFCPWSSVIRREVGPGTDNCTFCD